jgi:anti-anti-sigma factor
LVPATSFLLYPERSLVDNELLIQTYRDVTVVNFQNISVLDSANIESLGRSLLELVQVQDHRKLILDFSTVRFMSSQALGMIIQLRKALDAIKGKVLIVGIRPDLYKVFKITNLHKMFTFYEELDKALAAFEIIIPKG